MKIKMATPEQNKAFARSYCWGDAARAKLVRDFHVEVESYEKLLPDQGIESFATGGRIIVHEVIIFKVVDVENGVVYFPAFSVAVGRALARAAGLSLPRKMGVLTEPRNGGGGGAGGNGRSARNVENKKMLFLIQYVRSLWLYHAPAITPMYGPLRRIYTKLEAHPEYNVFVSDILRINSAIKTYLKSDVNLTNEAFDNLAQYIAHLAAAYPGHNLRDHDFDILRYRLHTAYPNVEIYF